MMVFISAVPAPLSYLNGKYVQAEDVLVLDILRHPEDEPQTQSALILMLFLDLLHGDRIEGSTIVFY